ncbi:MBL fold metallo-hydrolase [Paraflavisolibacter sp. H34]|uniref:MBL fold metallo-hydrolase n=1 Tax=Huijunlia imazamoxiresistens TaxID=3127457 RepID=UPI003015AC4A
MPRNSINCYVAEGFLIDAGIRSSAAKILNSIRDKGVHTHVLTHAHADHQGSSKAICERLGIELWCSEPERAAAESGDATADYPGQGHLVTRFQKKFWAGGGQTVSRSLKENDLIGNFRVVETPGHSRGHLSFFRESDGLLIVGDVAVNMNLLTTITGLQEPPALFTRDREANRRSIKKLAALRPKILCFGHGPVLINNGSFERFAQKL